MQQLSIAGLDAHFEALLRTIPQERRALFERLAPQLEGTVRNTVAGTGKVASWQVAALGSKGGYAAVHPKPKTQYKGYAVGYITNAITGGHKSRSGSLVPGKQYYERAMPQARAILEREVRALEKTLKEAVEE